MQSSAHLRARRLEQRLGGGYLFTFLVCCATALAIYIPFLIIDKGLFQYCGDFNSQQIPFYTYMNGFVKDWSGQWSWETDLGSSAVNSYAFYLLGSPFFWLSLLLPQAWMPFAMVPLLVLKFGVCGLGAYGWLRRYARTKRWAVVAAVLYAFSGFTVYNTFFNHFVDVIALFPFLLWALDSYMYDGRRAAFPVLVALNCVNNYFFFAGQIVFLFLYFFIRLACGQWRIKASAFLRLAFESLLGCAMGCTLLIPAILCLSGNPRTVDLSSGFGFLLYGRVQQYFAILTSLFLPPDPTYLPNIFTDAVIKHTSMTAYLPVVGIAGVWAYMKARPKSALTRMLWACLVMALVPVLNSSFYALNSSYYARWYYMPILLMCAATMKAFEQWNADLDGAGPVSLWAGVRPVAVITALYAVFALVPKEEDGTWSLGVVQNQAQFWLIYLTAILGVLLLCGLALRLRRSPRFAAAMLACILGFSWFYAVAHISMGKFPQWDRDAAYRAQCYEAARSIDWGDESDEFFRTDTYATDSGGVYDNLSLWMETPSLRFFNSVVTPSIMDFYPRVGVTRDVSSKPDQELYALRGLLGVRYILTTLDDQLEFADDYSRYGYTFHHADDTFAYFYNQNVLPMGFAYDKYILLEAEDETEDSSSGGDTADTGAAPTLMGLPENQRANMLVRAIALTEEQAAAYGHLMEAATTADTADLSYDAYVQDVAARRTQAVSSFSADHTGFTATITLDSENLVFFSVPYDEGFTATVNGVETPVVRVSGGMCAVLCPAGDSTIVFTYQTPGLALSLALTGAGWAVWAVYALFCRWERRAKGPLRTAPDTPPSRRRHVWDEEAGGPDARDEALAQQPDKNWDGLWNPPPLLADAPAEEDPDGPEAGAPFGGLPDGFENLTATLADSPAESSERPALQLPPDACPAGPVPAPGAPPQTCTEEGTDDGNNTHNPDHPGAGRPG